MLLFLFQTLFCLGLYQLEGKIDQLPQTNSSGFGCLTRINFSRVSFFTTLFIFFSECGLSLKERRKMAIFASTGNVNTTILNVSNTYLDQ